ncbi:MAG: hypothetical protein MH472_00250, partial [Bacteroidia bacterium]|nr:hypothetical protein [Bacteroidia bacterium]
ALDSFKNSETPLYVHVFDTKRDSLTFAKILTKKEVSNSDLIIGPVLKEGNEMMVDYCKKNKKYHISPFLTLTKSNINNPYLISVYPDLNYYPEFILQDILKSGAENPIIYVAVGKESNDKIIANKISSLKSKYPNFTFKQADISKISDWSKLYNPSKSNYFIIASENEFQVGSALKTLSDTMQFTQVEVYGFRKWLEFKAPNINQLELLKVKIISPFYFDYTSASNKGFVAAYREKYFTEPEEYAVAGFEQGLFFIRALINNKGNLDAIQTLEEQKILSNYYKIRVKDGAKSLQNSKLNVLYFEEGALLRKD